MHLFQTPILDDPVLRLFVIAGVIFIAVWRFTIVALRAIKEKRLRNNTASKDSRRMVIKLLDLDESYFESPIRRKVESLQSPFWAGLFTILFGGRSIGCFGLSLVFILSSTLISLMLLGWNSILETLIFYSSRLLFLLLLFIGIQVIVFLYYFYVKGDFRYLIEGIFCNRSEHKSKINAFQKAIRIFPSEYGYANLADQYKFLAIKAKDRIDKYWSGVDYSRSIEYYYKASSMAPERTELIEKRISLKKKMKDYEGVLEDFYLIKEIEEKNKSKSIYAREGVLGTILYQWGTDLTYAGEYNLALEKFDESLKILKGYTGDSVYHRLRLLHRSRAICYYRMNQNDLAIRDNYKFVENFISMCEDDLNEARKEMGDRIGENIQRWREELTEELDIIYPPFKANEDIESAIKFLQEFYDKKDQVGYPIFAIHLINLLIANGKISEAKKVYTDYLDSGFLKDQWFDEWLSDSFSSRQQFLNTIEEIRAAKNPRLLFVYLFQSGRADLAREYIEEALKGESGQMVLFTAGMMFERQWNYTTALDCYREYFKLKGCDYSDERIIGKIKKFQRKLEEALDCYEEIISEFKKNGKSPDKNDLINLVQIKDELGDYWGALELLINYDLKYIRKADGSFSNEYYVELIKKKVAKDRILKR